MAKCVCSLPGQNKVIYGHVCISNVIHKKCPFYCIKSFFYVITHINRHLLTYLLSGYIILSRNRYWLMLLIFFPLTSLSSRARRLLALTMTQGGPKIEATLFDCPSDSSSLDTFKTALKTHLFNSVYTPRH